MPRELQNQPAGASLSVMFSRTQLAGSRLRIVARQINHLCRGSLDNRIRLDLQHIGNSFFFWVWLSAIVVAVGCAMEGPELFHELWPKTFLFFSGRWVKKIALIGWLLVVLGVAAEGVFEALDHQAEGILQTFNDILLADAQIQAGNAKASAGDAAKDATSAQASADAASRTAGNAKAEAGAVASKADDLDRQLATTKTQLDVVEAKRAELEKSLVNMAVCNAPRVIPFWSIGNTKTSIDPLKPFAGRHVIVEFVPDAEARRAALNVASALDRAGWKIDRITPLDGINDGVAVQPYFVSAVSSQQQVRSGRMQDWEGHIRASDAADAVIDFLHSYNWQANWEWPQPGTNDIPRDGIKIRIGLYPAVTYVSPPGAKNLADALAQFDKNRQESMKKIEDDEAKREEEMLQHLSPEQASSLRAAWKRNKAERKAEDERISGPCQPLRGLTPRLTP